MSYLRAARCTKHFRAGVLRQTTCLTRMKNWISIACFLVVLFGAGSARAQISFGIKGGLNTQINKPDDIVINPGDTTFNLGIDDLKFGTQFGAYLRIGKKIYLQPELVFNSNRTDFKFGESSAMEVIKTERYQYLDMPILAGFSAGPFLVHGGPVGHYFLNSKSELTDIDGYKARFKAFTWGWTAGVTIGKGRVSADLRYEGNFNKTGDHITFFGDEYNFANNPSRLLVNLNIKIF
jgi:hypothetical protein